MARAAKLDLRAFQQELATRLAAKTAAQVESSRLGLVVRRRALADPPRRRRRGDHRCPTIVPVPLTQAVVPRHREHPRQPLQRRRLRAASSAAKPSAGAGPRRGWSCSARASASSTRASSSRACSACATSRSSRRRRRRRTRPRGTRSAGWTRDGNAWQEIDLAHARARPGVPAGRRFSEQRTQRDRAGRQTHGAQASQSCSAASPAQAWRDGRSRHADHAGEDGRRRAPAGYDPLASVSIMEQLRTAQRQRGDAAQACRSSATCRRQAVPDARRRCWSSFLAARGAACCTSTRGIASQQARAASATATEMQMLSQRLARGTRARRAGPGARRSRR